MHEDINKNEANKALYIAGAIIVLLIIGLFTNGFGLFSRDDSPGGARTLQIGSAPVLGAADAPVTIYEFSDFSCPYCAAAAGAPGPSTDALRAQDSKWQAPMPNIKEKYVAKGKVRLVFKYFPGHGSGTAAHIVGWCLNEQGLFWEFHDRAFAQQAETGSMSAMQAIARVLGANVTALQACIDENRTSVLLQRDAALGRTNGVSGTPTFFINGKAIVGAQSFDTFEREIEKALEKR
ncbi:MAG TPA: thioredoxin domain-containing protein [Candidatus Nanoarchaeia archaeon]|nr:thioredoxin domain-containing protein [Candidatus Nanoarchaeia archaeon]